MQAALDLADSGFKVHMVQRDTSVGGTMVMLDKTFPTGDCAMCMISPKMVEVGRHLNIDIHTLVRGHVGHGPVGRLHREGQEGRAVRRSDEVHGLRRLRSQVSQEGAERVRPAAGPAQGHLLALSPGSAEHAGHRREAAASVSPTRRRNAAVCAKRSARPTRSTTTTQDQEIELKVGSIILGPGLSRYDARVRPELGLGRWPNVVTSIQFERILSASGPYKGVVQRPSDQKHPVKVAWIQCVGSRDQHNANPWCSSVCCMYATKQSIIAKEHDKNIEPTIFYMEMRAFGKDFDKYVERAKNDYGVKYQPRHGLGDPRGAGNRQPHPPHRRRGRQARRTRPSTWSSCPSASSPTRTPWSSRRSSASR